MKHKNAALAVASLMVAVTPVLASAATAANTTVNTTVNSNIAITGTATVTLVLSPTTTAVQSTGSATYVVDTNNSNGYNLKIKDVDASLNLVGTPGGTITPGTGTQAAPAVLSNGQWGWAVVGAGGAAFDTTYAVANNAVATGKKFAGITAADAQFKSTASPAASDNTIVYYSALVSTAQQQGSYTDQVVVTSTVNP